MYSLQSHIFKSLPQKEQEKLIIEFCNISKFNPKYLDIDYGYKKEEERESIEKIYCYLDFGEKYKQNIKLFNKYQIVKFLQKSESIKWLTEDVVNLTQYILNTVLKNFNEFSDGIEGYSNSNYSVKFHIENDSNIKYEDGFGINYVYDFDDCLSNKPESFEIWVENYLSLTEILLNIDLLEKFKKKWCK